MFDKQGHERQIFARFCGAAGLEILDGSIEQPKRDPPDLRAHVKGQGPTAFELVRLNTAADLKYKYRLQPGEKSFNSSFAALPDGRRDALNRKFARGGVAISFSGSEPDSARKRALGFLWRLLEDIPAEYHGEVRLPRPSAPLALDSVYVMKPHCSDGPHWRTFGSRGPDEIDLDQLRKKLETPYDGSERLELLAYVDQGEIAWHGATEHIAQLVAEILPRSKFHTVWVYEGLLDCVSVGLCRATTGPL
jgi:hypothetical protein